jgi:hypothetical protein
MTIYITPPDETGFYLLQGHCIVSMFQKDPSEPAADTQEGNDGFTKTTCPLESLPFSLLSLCTEMGRRYVRGG